MCESYLERQQRCRGPGTGHLPSPRVQWSCRSQVMAAPCLCLPGLPPGRRSGHAHSGTTTPQGPPPRGPEQSCPQPALLGRGSSVDPAPPSPKATLSTTPPGLYTSLTLSLVEPGGNFSNRLSYPENEREVLPGNMHLHTYVYSTGSMQTA